MPDPGGGGGGGGGERVGVVSSPAPHYTAVDGLHHRYVMYPLLCDVTVKSTVSPSLTVLTVGELAVLWCAVDFTALSGGLSSKVLAFLERCVSSGASVAFFLSDGEKKMHVTLVTFNRLNGPSKVLTATDGQQIKLTANYFSRFNHVISKLPGHGHGRPSNLYGHGRSVLAAASLIISYSRPCINMICPSPFGPDPLPPPPPPPPTSQKQILHPPLYMCCCELHVGV